MKDKYLRFDDLPDFLKSYIRELVKWDAPDWVTRPIPALSGRCFLDILNEEGVVAAADFLTNVGTKFGLPHGVEVPKDFQGA